MCLSGNGILLNVSYVIYQMFTATSLTNRQCCFLSNLSSLSVTLERFSKVTVPQY